MAARKSAGIGLKILLVFMTFQNTISFLSYFTCCFWLFFLQETAFLMDFSLQSIPMHSIY